VATPKVILEVLAPAAAPRDSTIKVRASGLLPRESYVVKLGGDKVAKGVANDRGKVARKLKVSSKLALGKTKVLVRGSTRKRAGSDTTKVVAASGRAVDPRLERILV
jgi:hypothetical protein